MLNRPLRILSTKILSAGVQAIATQTGTVLDMQGFIDIALLGADEVKEMMQAVPANAIVILTSANAAKALTATGFQRPHWQIACLEGATRDAVLEHFDEQQIVLTAADATSLAGLLLQRKGLLSKGGDLLLQQEGVPLESKDLPLQREGLHEVYFFCGDQRRDTIPLRLQVAGINVQERIVYYNTATPALTTEIYDAVLFFSPTAVKSFFSMNTLPAQTTCFAIGPTTGAALQTHTTNTIITSDNPGAATLLHKAIDHLDKL